LALGDDSFSFTGARLSNLTLLTLSMEKSRLARENVALRKKVSPSRRFGRAMHRPKQIGAK